MLNTDTRNLDSRIGCHCWGDNPASIHSLDLSAKAGCRWVRATRQTQWDVVSTGPRRYNFADNGEASIDKMLGLGMSVMGILDARWGNETGLNKLPFASPVWEHLDLWEDFTAAAVKHYRGRIGYWEILNEPPFFWWYPAPEGIRWPDACPPMQRAPIRHYAAILRSASRVIRELDPQAKIVVGAGFPDGCLLRSLYELGCGDCFDIASVHYLNFRHPTDFARGHNVLREVMREYGDADKELWDTETGSHGAVIGHAVQTPDEYEGLYNIYRHCIAHEAGLARYFWFNRASAELLSAQPDNLPTAYRCMQTLHRHVGEGILLGTEHPQGEVHIYVFETPYGPRSILWATAPCEINLPSKVIEGIDYLGQPVQLSSPLKLTGRPLFLEGDLRKRTEVIIRGPRETVVASIKQPPPLTPVISCPILQHNLMLGDGEWNRIPLLMSHAEMPITQSGSCVAQPPTSIAADIRMASNPDSLLLNFQIPDSQFDRSNPTCLIQWSVRDSISTITEWPYFTNGYALLSLLLDNHGLRLFRHEVMYPDHYCPGRIANTILDWQVAPDGLVINAIIPWAEIGPCRPGVHHPFLFQFAVAGTDHQFAVPASEDAAEWPNNFADNFIVKPPSAVCNVDFFNES